MLPGDWLSDGVVVGDWLDGVELDVNWLVCVSVVV